MPWGVSPFHQVGAGKLTSTVSWPGLAGAAIGIEPLTPVISQLPIMSAAKAAAGTRLSAAMPAAKKMVDRVTKNYSLKVSPIRGASRHSNGAHGAGNGASMAQAGRCAKLRRPNTTARFS